MKILTKVMDLLALSVILSFMILMFSGCQMASGTLSEKEITVFNTEFFNPGGSGRMGGWGECSQPGYGKGVFEEDDPVRGRTYFL